MADVDTIDEVIVFVQDSFEKLKELSEQIKSKTEEIKKLSRQLGEQSAEIMKSQDPLVVQFKSPENNSID